MKAWSLPLFGVGTVTLVFRSGALLEGRTVGPPVFEGDEELMWLEIDQGRIAWRPSDLAGVDVRFEPAP